MKTKLPKFPQPLRQRLVDAVDDAEHEVLVCYGHTDWKPVLDRWRVLKNMRPEDVSEELLSDMRLLQKRMNFSDDELRLVAPLTMARREGMSTELWSKLERLDKVFSDVHTFDPSQALCQGIPELSNSLWRTGAINKETRRAKDYLRSVNYLDARHGSEDDHGTKGFHRKQVLKYVSSGTLQKITSELKAERLNSQKRTEK